MTGLPIPRVAALGDVHANAAALEAVLAQIRALGIVHGVCTGDLVLRGPEPEACVARLALLGWSCVRGNTDEKVVGRPPHPASHPAASRVGSRSWTARRLSEASLMFLRELPHVARASLGGFRVVVMHASPHDATRVLVDVDTPAVDLAQVAEDLGADCVVVGHTHRPFVRRVGRCVFVNPGSLGEADGADQRPAWAVLEAGPAGVVATLMRSEVPLAVRRAA